EAAPEPRLGGPARPGVVRRPVGDTAAQRGRDHEHIGAFVAGARLDEPLHVGCRDSLVGDHEQAPRHRALTPAGTACPATNAAGRRSASTRSPRVTTAPSTKSDATPSGSHQLPMSSAPLGRPTVLDHTNAANAPSASSAAP